MDGDVKPSTVSKMQGHYPWGESQAQSSTNEAGEPRRSLQKTFPRKSIHTEISPLAPPDFQSRCVALINNLQFPFKGKPHTWSSPAARSRKSGYASVEMTKGRVALPERVVAQWKPLFISPKGLRCRNICCSPLLDSLGERDYSPY